MSHGCGFKEPSELARLKPCVMGMVSLSRQVRWVRGSIGTLGPLEGEIRIHVRIYWSTPPTQGLLRKVNGNQQKKKSSTIYLF